MSPKPRFDDEVLVAPAPKQPHVRNARGRGGLLKAPNWSFTDEIAQAVLLALSLGAPIRTACDVAGIGERTYYEWLRRGSKEMWAAVGRCRLAGGDESRWHEYVEPPDMVGLAKFAEKVQMAHANAEVSYLSYIRKHAGRTWQAAAWMLERRWPEVYGKRPLPAEEAPTTGGTTVSVYLPSNHRDGTVTTGVIVRQQPATKALPEALDAEVAPACDPPDPDDAA